MNARQWAVFFVVMLSFDYTTALFFGNYKGVSKPYDNDGQGYYGWNRGCRCHKDLISSLDGSLKKCGKHIGKYNKGFPVGHQSMEEYEFENGHIQGLEKLERRGPYRCSVSRKHARIFFVIGFVRILIRYTLSVVDDILHGILGGVFSIFGRCFGRVTDALFRIVLPDVSVTVVLTHSFGSGEGFIVEGLYLSNIDRISFLDDKFSRPVSSLKSYFRPMCDNLLRKMCHDKLPAILGRHYRGVKVHEEMFSYESKEVTYEEDDDDDYSDDY